VGVKNTLIDRVIQLLVDLSLTEEERYERINITQQRSTSSPSIDEEILIVANRNKGFLEAIGKVDLVLVGTANCIKQARHFIRKRKTAPT